jgi:hypothetical protein
MSDICDVALTNFDLRRYWTLLKANVHPCDVSVIDNNDHCLNLEYPPPAFIGNIDTAAVIILRNNGGFGEKTACEFLSQDDQQQHIDWLHGKRTEFPERLSPWYTNQKWFERCKTGQIALVNAVAYRSPRFTREPKNIRLARALPSRIFHHDWLVHKILPEARMGKKMIVAHNWSAWGFSKTVLRDMRQLENIVFCNNAISPRLTEAVWARIEHFLDSPQNKDTAFGSWKNKKDGLAMQRALRSEW